MKRMFFVLLALLCLGLAACSQQTMMSKLEPKAESAVARSMIDQLRSGNIDAIKAKLDPKYVTPDVDAKLRSLADEFPAGTPESVKIIGANRGFNYSPTQGSKIAWFNLTYEYQFDKAWVVANMVLVQHDNTLLIEGIHVNRSSASLESRNAFALKDKDATHWLMLLLTGAALLFNLFAFVLCLCTPMRGRKWLWALFTLVGVTTLRFDWTNGHFAFQPVSMQVFSASATSQFYGPWILAVSIPLGAIVFLLRRQQLRRVPVAPPPMSSDPIA